MRIFNSIAKLCLTHRNIQDEQQATLKQAFDLIQERSEQVQRQGGQGVAIAIASCYGMKNVIPLGIEDKLDCVFPGAQQWKEQLKRGLEQNAG